MQVLCHAVIFDANRERRTVVTAHDVEAAVRALEMSEAHLLALCAQRLTPAEQAAARYGAQQGSSRHRRRGAAIALRSNCSGAGRAAGDPAPSLNPPRLPHFAPILLFSGQKR